MYGIFKTETAEIILLELPTIIQYQSTKLIQLRKTLLFYQLSIDKQLLSLEKVKKKKK